MNFQNEYTNLDLTRFYLRISKTGNMISKNPIMISEILVRTLEMHKGRQWQFWKMKEQLKWTRYRQGSQRSLVNVKLPFRDFALSKLYWNSSDAQQGFYSYQLISYNIPHPVSSLSHLLLALRGSEASDSSSFSFQYSHCNMPLDFNHVLFSIKLRERTIFPFL